MPNEFDPYSEWLGIRSPERPLSHYGLLGLDDFEADAQVIAAAADRAMALVRKVRPGPQAEAWRKLLDELGLAKMCLSDPARKGQYDAQLRTRTLARVLSRRESVVEVAPPNPDLFPPTRAAARTPDEPAAASNPSGYTPPVAPTYSAPLAAEAAPTAQPYSGGAYSPPTADPAPIQPSYMPAYGQNPQQLGFGQQPGYAPQQQQPMYGQPGYVAPQPGYGTSVPGYGTAQPMYGAGQPGYGNPQQAYPAQQQYGNAFPPGYQAPNATPVAGYGQATPVYGQAYGTPSAGQPYGAPQQPSYTTPQYGAAPYGNPQAAPGYQQPYQATPVNPAPVMPTPVAPTEPDLHAFETMPSIESLLSGASQMPSPTPSYSAPSYSTPSYSTPAYTTPSPTPSYNPPTSTSQPTAPESRPTSFANPAAMVSQATATKTESPAEQPQTATASGKTMFRAVGTPARPELEPLPPPGGMNVAAPRPLSETQERQKQNMTMVGVLGGVAVLFIVLIIMVINRRSGIEASATDPALAALIAKEKPKQELAQPPEKPAPVKPQPPVRPAPTERPKPVQPKPPAETPVAVVPPQKMPDIKPAPVEPKPEPKPVTPPPVTPPPPVNPPQPEPAADPGKNVAFQRALIGARKAMSDRDFERSAAELKKAESLATTPEQISLLEKNQTLNSYVLEFWAAVTKGLEGLKAADQITIGSTMAIVVSVGPDELVIRAAGAVRTYNKANMGAGVANAIANMWFDQANPTTKVFLGAFQAVDPNGDIETARRMWKDASLAGASVEDLIPLLDMNLKAVAIEQGPVPSDAEITAAEKDIEAKFATEISGATTTQKRRALADKLLQAAPEAESAAARYVCFHKSVELSVDIVNAVGIVQTIDEMAKWFTIDPLAMKADALELADKSNTNSIYAKAVTREAIQAGEEALAASQNTAAKTLSKAATASSQKARDPELVRQAKALEEKVKNLP